MPTGDLPKGWRRDPTENELWHFESEKFAGEKVLPVNGQMAVETVHVCGARKDERGYNVSWLIENKETSKYLEYINRQDAVNFDEDLQCIHYKVDAVKKAREKQQELSHKYFRKIKSSGFFDIWK